MATLSAAPNPAPASSIVAVAGTAFPWARTRLLLDGAANNVFRPRKDGTFNVGVTVGAVAKTQVLIAQQLSGSSWTEKARVSIVVQAGASPQPPAIPTLHFGMVDHPLWHTLAESQTDINRIAAAGMTVMRFDLAWRWAEPADGTYDMAYVGKFETVLDQLATAGIQAIVTVGETPGWANGNQAWNYPPTTRQKYADFMGWIAAREASRPNMTWEIMNETNDPGFWAPTPSVANYTDLLVKSYTAIKAADPDATVLNGGILFNDANWLNGIYSNGGGDSFDGLALHPYCPGRSPSDTSVPWFSFTRCIDDHLATLTANGDSAKKIYITEFGWGIAPYSQPVTEAQRATYVAAAVPLIRARPSVAAACLYVMNTRDFATFGVWDFASGTPTGSWTAYKNAVNA